MNLNFTPKVHAMRCFVLLVLLISFWGCKKEEESTAQVHDPNVPVKLSSFMPESGGVGTQLIIHGSNFGSDTSKIKVYINDKRAILIGSNGDYLYALVPSRAGKGIIKVVVSTDGKTQETTFPTEFNYIFNPSVSTLAGFTDKDGKTAIVDGPIDKAQFEEPYWLTFDQHKNIYLLEQYRGLRFINAARTEVKTLFRVGNGLGRPRTLSFTPSFDTLYVTNDQGSLQGLSTAVLTPASGFKVWNSLIYDQTTNGGAAHPQTGDYFYNSYEKGEVYKWNPATRTSEYLFRVNDVRWEFNIQFAPSGDFAYIVVVNRHYILKSRFNRQTRRLEDPVHLVGGRGSSGYNDGVGIDSRFNNPHQGTFDEDDNFYVADVNNHCIRKITPLGVVSTFAGKPRSPGYADGPLREAQFDQPFGIIYDRDIATFYVADMVNRRIRTISVQ